MRLHPTSLHSNLPRCFLQQSDFHAIARVESKEAVTNQPVEQASQKASSTHEWTWHLPPPPLIRVCASPSTCDSLMTHCRTSRNHDWAALYCSVTPCTQHHMQLHMDTHRAHVQPHRRTCTHNCKMHRKSHRCTYMHTLPTDTPAHPIMHAHAIAAKHPHNRTCTRRHTRN